MPSLIESYFPFSELSLIAERESWRKEIYRPIYYIHKWWARRLGSVFRGIILGACLDESKDFWQHYYSKNNFKEKTIFDPFMGSGVTIGEAIKLGCRAIGRDINQVAYLSSRAAFSKYSIGDVISTFKHLEESIAPTLLNNFRTVTATGEAAIVLYYFLVKLVDCPYCDEEIELFKTRIFSQNAIPRKDPTARSICPNCGSVNNTLFDAKEVTCHECKLTYSPGIGNIKGAIVTCNHCGKEFVLVNRMQHLSGPLKIRRYAKLVLTPDGKKKYEPLNEYDREIERQISEEYKKIINCFPIVNIESGYNTDQMIKHNYHYWHELFSDRQLVCAKYVLDAIKQIDHDEIQLLFACLFSGALEFNNLFTSFKGEGTGAVRHMFAHHVLKPEMMPIEANLWGTTKSSGAISCLYHSRIERALGYKSDPYELRINGLKSIKVKNINQPVSTEIANNYSEFTSIPNSIYSSSGDSSNIDLPDKSVDYVITDPPFFDNVHYSELADFFFYWLNQIKSVSKEYTTRSPLEVQDTDSRLFTKKLGQVFLECHRVLRSDGLLIFTYHHSKHEGWTSVHQAIRNAGFICLKSYPIKAEMSVSMPLQQAKSPIHLDLILVCKKNTHVRNTKTSFAETRRALSTSKNQINSLRSVGINVSLGDAKVILMGQLLCEATLIQDISKEEKYLKEIEKNIDNYVSKVISTQGEVLYKRTTSDHVQLVLFEEMEKYITNK